MLYDSTINTHLTYCNIIWANTCKTYTENLIRLQKRALRQCSHNKPLTKTENLFCKANRLPVHLIAKLQLAKIVYLFYNATNELPDHIKLLFSKTSDLHTYPTRATDNMQLHKQYCKTNIRKFTPKILAPSLWNSLPITIRQTTPISNFTKNLKFYLFSLYSEDH